MYGRDMSWQAFVLLVVLFASMGNATRPASVVAGSVPAASADGVRALLERGYYFSARDAARALLSAAAAAGDSASVAEALEFYLGGAEIFAGARPADGPQVAARLVRIREAQLRPDSSALATSLLFLGSSLRVSNQVAQSRAPLERAIRERTYGPVGLEAAQSQFQLALTLRAQRDTSAARKLLQRSMETWHLAGC